MVSRAFTDVNWDYQHDEMQKAFQDAVEEETIEYGYGPFKGSISTTYLIGESTHSGVTPLPYDEAKQLIQGDYEHLEKGDSQGIFVYKNTWDYHNTIKQVDVTVKLHTSEIEQFDYSTLENDVENAVLAQANEEITKVLNQKSNSLNVKNNGKQLKGEFIPYDTTIDYDKEVQSIMNTITTKGERETRYFIAKVGNNRMQPWNNGYASQAEARKNLPTVLSSHDEYEIYALTRRASGEGLVSHTSSGLKPMTIECTVRGSLVVRELNKNENETGWLFYGWSS